MELNCKTPRKFCSGKEGRMNIYCYWKTVGIMKKQKRKICDRQDSNILFKYYTRK